MILHFLGIWRVLLPQTQFTGNQITNSPVPATIAFHLSNDEWIVAVVNHNFMKMVKFQVTGVNSFDWIATKYIRNGNYGTSCLTDFTEACFVGTDSGEQTYTVDLVASNEGTNFSKK